MKNIILLLCFHLICFNLSAQSVKGEIRELSVNAFDGAIWLASNAGIVYRTHDLQNDFKIILQLPEPKPGYFGGKEIQIEHITFFNKDTLFISGYIGNDLIGKERGTPDKIFLSYNGGKDWKLKSFGSSGIWIYNCITDKAGNAWMGGSNGKIYYSNDYGNNWKKIASPFNSKSRLGCIDKGTKIGVLGATENKIKISSADFHSFKSFDTPFDTKAYVFTKEEIKKNYIDNGIKGIKLIGDTIIIANQENFVFFSGIQKPSWKKFDPELTMFSYDTSTENIIGVTNENKIVSFNSIMLFTKNLIEISKDEKIIDLKSVKGIVYVLTEKYFPKKKGEDIVGTFGNMQVVQVGYRKKSHYIIYKITNGETKKLVLEVN